MSESLIIQPQSETQKKACPYLPAIPIMSKVAPGRVDGLSPTPCMENACAVFESCQGEYSPKALHEKAEARSKANRETIAKALISCESLPMVGLPLKSMGEKLMASGS